MRSLAALQDAGLSAAATLRGSAGCAPARGMIERSITLRLSLRVQRISPLRAVIAALCRIVTSKKAVGKAIVVTDDPGGVGVLPHVLLLDAVVRDGIVDHATDEGDVGARAQFGEHVRE